VKTCDSCRWWSDRIARSDGTGPLQALCLPQSGGIFAGEYVTGRQSCDAFADGQPVDAAQVNANIPEEA
jgi:hypothetical protein